MAEAFTESLLRLVAAELHLQNGLAGAQAMFGKGYTSLSPTEKAAVDQFVIGTVSSNFQALTPEYLTQQETQPMGFRARTETST